MQAGPAARTGGGLRSRTRYILGAAVAGLAALCGGCAAPGADVHLAPLWSRLSTADGATEREALGGFYHRREDAAGELEFVRFGPLYSFRPRPPSDQDGVHDEYEGGWQAHYLVPLGTANRRGIEASAYLLPLFYWGRGREADGSMGWKLAALPGVLMEDNEVAGFQFGIFPLWGRFEDFVTYDQLVFVLWPLFVYAERAERVSYHFLWPVLGWTTGGGESSFRLWPFYGRTRWEGRFDRTFVLWPFFHYQRNFLGGGGEEPETVWWVWPFYGNTQRGTFEAHTVLWPFFGYSSDPRSGFWALDAPWPFVRFQRGPDDVHRSRVWPFYSYTRADGLETTSYLWPIVQFRNETSAEMERTSTWVVPFWQSWDRTDLESGETSAWRKLWPLFQHEREGAWSEGSFPTLDPFWRNDLIDDHYAWAWKLWAWERGQEYRRERAWLGLYRRERGLGEDRRSLAGLWARRGYHDDAGRRVRETSLLFGLFRWRVTEDEGFDMLAPAFPGPGWPALEEAVVGATAPPIAGTGR